jgi:hypothetical protein
MLYLIFLHRKKKCRIRHILRLITFLNAEAVCVNMNEKNVTFDLK